MFCAPGVLCVVRCVPRCCLFFTLAFRVRQAVSNGAVKAWCARLVGTVPGCAESARDFRGTIGTVPAYIPGCGWVILTHSGTWGAWGALGLGMNWVWIGGNWVWIGYGMDRSGWGTVRKSDTPWCAVSDPRPGRTLGYLSK